MKPRKKTVESLMVQINACKRRIGNERDRLRELIGELEEIESGCDEAIDNLDNAADALSLLL